MSIDKSALRDAATLVVLRRDLPEGPAVLMGMRGAGAAFMPSKYVFPGGALDAGDGDIALAAPLPETCAKRLAQETEADLGPALAVAAIRELWEETGLILGAPGAWQGDIPADWAGFAATGHRPSAAGLRFFFRAITPPGRPRRFDARFFLVEASELASDPDDFSRACDELSHLHWVSLPQARALNLPFITEVVLAEVQAQLSSGPPATIPFFDNRGPRATFARLG
ncbi:8-oxo-dGTP pyrophosphatase MutT (NUDIX family) [Rhodobacter sp. JA431]|uniref:NUDIX hydrolase n=1 Tax=Rhodobacter sp. JA431 TaxID=570013 RepID=UPI000BCA214A|nr:NUDIX hydrolase [Rhodobacter sp. JA431]SOB90982.1 8-oxo-dGTP pyrophosphatase MutT (NUDIX family) [Rhodobacter sp. JA431]